MEHFDYFVRVARIQIAGRKLVKFELWLGGLSTVAATLADNQPSPGCFTVFSRCN